MAKPKIRFKGFEEEWETSKIGDLTSIVTGATPSTAIASYWDNGTIRWMSSGELNDKYIYDVRGRITDEGYRNSGTHLIPPNCVLIGLAGQGKTRGTAAINHVKLCTNQSIAALLPNFKLFNPFYLFHYIDNKYLELRNLSTGDGGRGGLNKQILLDFEVKLASLDEQKALAYYFKSLDSLIQTTTKKIASLKQMKSACLVSMFPQEGETTPRVRFKGFEGEWEKVKLSSIATRVTRKNSHLESKLPLTISAAEGLIEQTAFFNNVVASSNVSGYYLVKKGEFAYNKSYSNGYPFGAVKRLDRYDQGVLSTLYIVFSIDSSVCSDYIVHFFDTSLWHKEVAKRAAEGARNHGLLNIGAEDFLDIDIVVPKKKSEQQQIASYFNTLDTQISLQEQHLEKLKQIKSACLDKMFV